MKKLTLLVLLAISSLSVFTTGCSKTDDDATNVVPSTQVEAKMVTSLEATEKIYLNLTTGAQIPAAGITATNWDVSFYGKDRNIELAVNSGSEGTGTAGAQLVSVGFDDLKEAPANGYLPGKEATGDYLQWSLYTGSTSDPKHAVLPKPGMCIVMKTADGKFAKLQILSLYKGNPNTSTPEFAELTTRPAFGYFSFRYATQQNGTRNF